MSYPKCLSLPASSSLLCSSAWEGERSMLDSEAGNQPLLLVLVVILLARIGDLAKLRGHPIACPVELLPVRKLRSMEGESDFTRFRTPRTLARLRQMYDDAINIPSNPTRKGPDARAPPHRWPNIPTPNGPTVRVPASIVLEEFVGNRDGIWYHHAHLITDIGHRVYKVKASEEQGVAMEDYDVPKLAKMFPEYTTACRRFALEEDVEPEGFIACAVYALCEPTHAAQCHNVYRGIAFEAFYQTCIEFPEWLSDAIRSTWSYPGEVFTGFIPTHQRQ